MDALEPHVISIETSMPAVQDTLESLGKKIDSLKGKYVNFRLATKALIQDQANFLSEVLRIL